MRRPLSLMLLLLVSLAAQGAPRAAERVTAVSIVAAARTRLDAKLAGARAAAKVTVVGKPEDVSVRSGVVTLDAHAVSGRWPRARVAVPVDIRVDGQVVQSATVWFALAVHRQVLTYAADAPMGTLAASLKLVPRDADVAVVQGELIGDLHDVHAMRLHHSVEAGAVAVREDFERVPDVDRQQRVQVLLTAGAIRVQAKGTAMANGNAGDTISVLVDNAKSPVQARITDRGVVQVVQ